MKLKINEIKLNPLRSPFGSPQIYLCPIRSANYCKKFPAQLNLNSLYIYELISSIPNRSVLFFAKTKILFQLKQERCPPNALK